VLVDPTRLDVPEVALVLLVGPTGSGKSTFAARHFRPTEVLSSDAFRALVSGDEADMGATADAFELLHLAAGRRLGRRLLTVVDATNVRADARRPLLELARGLGVPAVAIAFDLPLELAAARNAERPGRTVPRRVLRQQHQDLQRALTELGEEGFARVFVLRSPATVANLRVARTA
jgi:predicted kinase